MTKKATTPTTPEDMTIKQRKWLKLYLELGNATEAAMKVYNCKDRDSAANVGYENVRKLDFGALMEAKGITDAKLGAVLEEGLEATRIKTSMTEPDKIENDYAVRHKYLETALKLKGRVTEKVDLTSLGKQIAGFNYIVPTADGSNSTNDQTNT